MEKEVQSTDEEVDNTKSEEPTTPVEDDSKSENGESTENGEPAEKENGKGDEGDDKFAAAEDDTEKVCSIKRKSAGGDAPDETPAEGATPEKKAKLGETAEAESNGEAEVAA
ncbi:hypothetical protein BDFB_004528 [Asbolus verrucosus]|uniref:Uncharacterized protein n=1 Tax=Asbolus verrucosus TaxID=1661398 RepID=A0A482VC85_ASBVE|nr:hypothetical protein BDFB_004528 [Asbolus verrucosus]